MLAQPSSAAVFVSAQRGSHNKQKTVFLCAESQALRTVQSTELFLMFVLTIAMENYGNERTLLHRAW